MCVHFWMAMMKLSYETGWDGKRMKFSNWLEVCWSMKGAGSWLMKCRSDYFTVTFQMHHAKSDCEVAGTINMLIATLSICNTSSWCLYWLVCIYVCVCVKRERELISDKIKVISALKCCEVPSSKGLLPFQGLYSFHWLCMCVFVCGGYLRQGQSQGQSTHQQQMRLDPHHRPVCTAHWVDWLVCLQVVLGLNPKPTHSVNDRLCSR